MRGFAGTNDLAGSEKRDLIAQPFRGHQIVRREQHGTTPVCTFTQQRLDQTARFRIECLHRLIKREQGGARCQRLGEQDLALHAVAQVANTPVQGHCEAKKQISAPLFVGGLVEGQRELEQIQGGHPVIQGGLTGAVSDLLTRLKRAGDGIHAVDRDRPGVGLHHTDQTTEECGFSRSIGTDEAQDRASLDLHGHVQQYLLVTKSSGEVADLKHAGEPIEFMARCTWCGSDPQYVEYHDTEWGVPILSSPALFEKLMLDAFQSGLSWLVVLRKRKAIVQRLHLDDPRRTARLTARSIEAAMKDPATIRNRPKIEACVHNARIYVGLQQQKISFSELLWSHVGGSPITNRPSSQRDIASRSPEGDAMARTLKAHGFKWTGPTVCHAFMQAVGMVNDHVVSCPRWAAVQEPMGGR